jgi:hypothetical protein
MRLHTFASKIETAPAPEGMTVPNKTPTLDEVIKYAGNSVLLINSA